MKNQFVCLAILILISSYNARSQEDSTSIDSIEESAGGNLLEQVTQEAHIDDVVEHKEPDSLSHSFLSIRSRFTEQLQRSAGYQKGDYGGSPLRSYQRLQFVPGAHLTGGLLLAKDAGESRLNDFFSGFLSISGLGLFNRIVAGDYKIEAGQGIALWRGYGFSKGGETIAPVFRNAGGLISSLSSDEVEYFRGLATEIRMDSIDMMLFYSRRNESGTRTGPGPVTSLYASGYYRTQNEQSKRDVITETLFGLRALYHLPERQEIGVTLYRTRFSLPLFLGDGRLFSGESYFMTSVDYRIRYRTITLFGEWAGMNDGVGGIGGILLVPSESVSMVSSFRSYAASFFSNHGTGLGERSGMSNEQGCYFGMNLHFSRSVTLSVYYDAFRFPDPSSSSKFPSGGHDMLTDLALQFSKHLVAALRYRCAVSEISQPLLDFQRTQHLRFDITYHHYAGPQLQTRLERIFIDNKYSLYAEKGFALFEDVAFNLHERLRTNFRLTFFTSDSYNSRFIYFERDIDGTMALPVLYGTGVRWYLLMKYTCSERTQVSLKYSNLLRDDVKHVGAGLDELPGNFDNRIGVQVDVRW